MSGWQFVVHEQAWEMSERLRGREKEELKTGLRKLLADPLQRPHAEIRSPTERTYSVMRIGRFRVIYWADTFPQELRLVKIERINPKSYGDQRNR
jgi:mRNA-degrading endonuclease RelE of RelBE toxin-antitoxin system